MFPGLTEASPSARGAALTPFGKKASLEPGAALILLGTAKKKGGRWVPVRESRGSRRGAAPVAPSQGGYLDLRVFRGPVLRWHVHPLQVSPRSTAFRRILEGAGRGRRTREGTVAVTVAGVAPGVMGRCNILWSRIAAGAWRVRLE